MKEEAQHLLRDFADHEQFAHTLSVRHKSGAIIPYALQPAQIKLNRTIHRIREQGRPVRIICLKARQVMVSTATAAQFFHGTAFQAGQKALIVAHEENASKNIWGYYKTFDDSYQPFRGLVRKSETVRAAPGSGELEYANGSWIRVSTANNVKTGRSFTLRYLHLSEYAFWRDARTLMVGLMQSVPDDPDTMVVIESTANGRGGDFYQRWQEATDPSSDSEWEPYFFAWWEHPEYSRPIQDPHRFQQSLSDEEHRLRESHNLTLEQLHWRRWAIVNKCGKSVDTFHQEYPSTAEEAFLYSGRPRFDLKSLAQMPAARRKSAEPAGMVGELVEEIHGPKPKLIFQPNEDRRGAVTVYKRPRPGGLYSVGIDVAEGIDINEDGRGDSDPDYSVATFIDIDSGEQVAKLRGRIEPSPFAEYVEAMARWYGSERDAKYLDPRTSCYLVPEANGPGIALIEALLALGYPPFMIFHRRRSPEQQFVDGDATELQTLGWKTTAVTRVQLISFHDQCIRDRSILIYDPHTLAEHESFIIDGRGKATAAEGSHDDEVIAAALAMKGIETFPKDERLKIIRRQTEKPKILHNSNSTLRKYGKRRLADLERGSLVRW